jgi:alpha-beta hydrolase superfamily lysophospholipase
MCDAQNNEFVNINLPIGYHDFHPVRHINFQINRWYSSGGYTLEEARSAGRRIRDFKDWKQVWIELGDTALAEGRTRNAAFCYRAAHFFTNPRDPDKNRLYDRFYDLFYKAHKTDPIGVYEVPYKHGKLRVLKLTPENPIGTFVMHGGGESFAEEFLPYMEILHHRGYEVINFEGPGQGAALHKYNMPFEYDWEHCTNTVLNYFNIASCAFMGISFGGWFCVRAAAFEPRIKQLIVFNVIYDMLECITAPMPFIGKVIFKGMLKYGPKSLFNLLMRKKGEKDSFVQFFIENAMFCYNAENPFDAYRHFLNYIPENQFAQRIRADVLLTSATEDHFIPTIMIEKQEKDLTNAMSIEKRYFTKEEHASAHCAVGNVPMAINAIADWLDRTISHRC